MQAIQFLQVTPEQLQDAIIKGIVSHLNDLKVHFQPKEPEVYLTRQEVSKMLKVDLSTIHNWCKSGKLTRYCIGNRVYFLRSQLEESIIPIHIKK